MLRTDKKTALSVLIPAIYDPRSKIHRTCPSGKLTKFLRGTPSSSLDVGQEQEDVHRGGNLPGEFGQLDTEDEYDGIDIMFINGLFSKRAVDGLDEK